MNWRVWRDRGYCALGDTISAYVDFKPTSSGAIRCVGPFSANSCSSESMQSAMRSLTLTLESSFLTLDQFVLWGSYCDYPQYREHEVRILGTICGYMPAPWLRTHLLGYGQDSLVREWIASPDKVIHRSGLQFPNTALSVVDTMLFHPSSVKESVAKLSEHAKHIGSSYETCKLRTGSSLPKFRWSLTTKVNGSTVTRNRLA